MKVFCVLALALMPVMSLANSSAKESAVSAELAATIVRQAGVEKCLSVVENNSKGVAYFHSIEQLSTKTLEDSSETKIKLSGSNLYGDVMAGSWEIEVTMGASEYGMTFDCNITKNEE